MPSPAPWARALLLCNIPGCLSVCLVFVVSKGSISVSAPAPSPSPPCACRSLLTLFISQRGHCQLPHLAGFRAQRFWQLKSIPCKTALERRGSCCGSVEGRSPWQVPPGSSSLLSGRPAWLRGQSTERGRAAVPSTNIICCRGCCRESQGSVGRGVSAPKVCGRRGATPVTVSPLPVLCFLCACAPEPPLCCRAASVLASPRWEDPNLKQKTKIRIGLQPLPLPSSANLSPVRSPSPCLVKSVGKRGER